VYFVFDLLFLDGRKVAGLRLLERKERLKTLVKGQSCAAIGSIQRSHIGDGPRFLQAACGAKGEGIISKRPEARFTPGNRKLWCNTKCYQQDEFIIVGYSEPERSRPYIGALLLAYYDDAEGLSTLGASAQACPAPSCAACTEAFSRFAPRRCRSTCHHHERATSDVRSISRELPGFDPRWSAKCAF
jgi:ATP-dependent DNA ligase